MYIYQRSTADHGRSKLVLVLGGGLIGNAIMRNLSRNGFELLSRYISYWTDSARRSQQYSLLKHAITEQICTGRQELHLVWSAGSGSFASSVAALRDEDAAFADTLELFKSLAQAGPATFHFLSSAGGLFEGQMLVRQDSSPRPRRPYGEMKLAQERRLMQCVLQHGLQAKIYRPSTVYGPHAFSQRAGLISNLFWNALRNAPTTLETHVDALRDYVLVDDVGDYLVKQLDNPLRGTVLTEFLVTGKPSSIHEIAKRVQRVLGKALLLQYSDRQRNDANITFCADVLPSNWHPTGLEEGLRHVKRATVSIHHRDATSRLQS